MYERLEELVPAVPIRFEKPRAHICTSNGASATENPDAFSIHVRLAHGHNSENKSHDVREEPHQLRRCEGSPKVH